MFIEDEEDKIQIGQTMADFGKAVNPNLPQDFVHEGLKRVYKPKDPARVPKSNQRERSQQRNIETQTELLMDTIKLYETQYNTASYGQGFMQKRTQAGSANRNPNQFATFSPTPQGEENRVSLVAIDPKPLNKEKRAETTQNFKHVYPDYQEAHAEQSLFLKQNSSKKMQMTQQFWQKPHSLVESGNQSLEDKEKQAMMIKEQDLKKKKKTHFGNSQANLSEASIRADNVNNRHESDLEFSSMLPSINDNGHRNSFATKFQQAT